MFRRAFSTGAKYRGGAGLGHGRVGKLSMAARQVQDKHKYGEEKPLGGKSEWMKRNYKPQGIPKSGMAASLFIVFCVGSIFYIGFDKKIQEALPQSIGRSVGDPFGTGYRPPHERK